MATTISVSYVARIFALCAALFLLWYIVMLLAAFYDPALHITATAASVFLVATGNSTGMINSLVARA